MALHEGPVFEIPYDQSKNPEDNAARFLGLAKTYVAQQHERFAEVLSDADIFANAARVVGNHFQRLQESNPGRVIEIIKGSVLDLLERFGLGYCNVALGAFGEYEIFRDEDESDLMNPMLTLIPRDFDSAPHMLVGYRLPHGAIGGEELTVLSPQLTATFLLPKDQIPKKIEKPLRPEDPPVVFDRTVILAASLPVIDRKRLIPRPLEEVSVGLLDSGFEDTPREHDEAAFGRYLTTKATISRLMNSTPIRSADLVR